MKKIVLICLIIVSQCHRINISKVKVLNFQKHKELLTSEYYKFKFNLLTETKKISEMKLSTDYGNVYTGTIQIGQGK